MGMRVWVMSAWWLGLDQYDLRFSRGSCLSAASYTIMSRNYNDREAIGWDKVC